MKALLKRKWVKICGLVIGFIFLTTFSGCLFFRIYRFNDLVAYYVMIHDNFHPVWGSLALRRIRKGDSLEKLFRLHTPPPRLFQMGAYTYLDYEYIEGTIPLSGLFIIAKHDRLIAAKSYSCTFQYTFFETPHEDHDFQYEYDKWWEQRLQLRDKEFLVHEYHNNSNILICQLVNRVHEGTAYEHAEFVVVRAIQGTYQPGERLSIDRQDMDYYSVYRSLDYTQFIASSEIFYMARSTRSEHEASHVRFVSEKGFQMFLDEIPTKNENSL